MRYMVVEHFKDAPAIYRRFAEHGRMMPEGLTYISSWIDSEMRRCFQLMETDDRGPLELWMSRWSDLMDFEVYPVITTAEAVNRMAERKPD